MDANEIVVVGVVVDVDVVVVVALINFGWVGDDYYYDAVPPP